MAKAKKTKKVEEVKIEDQSEQLEQLGEIQMREPKRFEECEWCYQFDEDEPKIFAWTSNDIDNKEEKPTVSFTLGNIEGAYISFSHNGKAFKLFARELTDEGRKLREFNEQQLKNLNADMENFDKKIDENGSENQKG